MDRQGQPGTDNGRQGQTWTDMDRQGQEETDRDRQGQAGHNCFGPPFLFVEGVLSTGPTPFLPLGKDGITIKSFSSIHVVGTRPALYKKKDATIKI